jgi:hypothetical protein
VTNNPGATKHIAHVGGHSIRIRAAQRERAGDKIALSVESLRGMHIERNLSRSCVRVIKMKNAFCVGVAALLLITPMAHGMDLPDDLAKAVNRR